MRRLAAVATVVALALALVGCADRDPLTVQALFDDVGDLVPRSNVQVADVPVGVVTNIELTDDNQALVTMEVDRSVALPSQVSAQLRKTNVLGERFVELVPDPSSGGSLPDGALITDTRLLPDLEDVVRAGSDLLAVVAAEKIAGAIEAGADGLGGRGQTMSTLLDDLTEIVSTYERNSEDLVRLLEGLDGFLAEVGPEAQLHGEAFEELARATAVLDEEDERLLDALDDLAQLARTGEDIMVTHRERSDRFFDRFNAVTREIAGRDEDLERLFAEVYKHNFNTIRGVNQEFGQIVLDFIVCGENETPGDPVRGCDNPPQGRSRPDGRGGGARQ